MRMLGNLARVTCKCGAVCIEEQTATRTGRFAVLRYNAPRATGTTVQVAGNVAPVRLLPYHTCKVWSNPLL
jgi:hypothetical protein